MNDKCRFFSDCGGCQLLDLEHKNYQDQKKLSLKQHFSKYSNLNHKVDWFWTEERSRRKAVLQIDSQNQIGYFKSRSNQIIEIDSCYICNEEISRLILPLKKIIKSLPVKIFKQIVITKFDSGINILLIANRDLENKEQEKLLAFGNGQQINISYQLNDEITPILILRKNQIFYPNFKIDLEPDIFIQANKEGSDEILRTIRSSIKKGENVIDLYSGYGAYAFGIADLAQKISSFEYSKKMVRLINQNAKSLQLTDKISANLKDLEADPLSSKELKKFSTAIINPPRAGAKNQIEEISKSKIQNIIYVSCNPKSFAPDANILISSNFKLKSIRAIDQFYGSNHIELVANFVKN